MKINKLLLPLLASITFNVQALEVMKDAKLIDHTVKYTGGATGGGLIDVTSLEKDTSKKKCKTFNPPEVQPLKQS